MGRILPRAFFTAQRDSFMTASLIRIENISLRFGSLQVLSDFSMDLRKGEFLSLIGPSGCGKTVLLKMISGLLKPASGEIRFHFDEHEKSHQLSIAFQDSLLFPWLTVRENIRICMNDRERTETEKKEMIEDLLELTRLKKFENHYPAQLSGGMKQKVNVLRCFGSDSSVILMDEPFSSLDFLQRTDLQEFTQVICQKKKKSILFVTHDIDEALYLSDRVLVMSQNPGMIIKEWAVPFSRLRHLDSVRSDPRYSALFREIKKTIGSQLEVKNVEENI